MISAAMKCSVGDAVEWTSQSAGFVRTKVGTVVEVVPAGKDPETPLRNPGGRRDHESYVVRAVAQGRKSNTRTAMYWPRVMALRPAGFASDVDEGGEVVSGDKHSPEPRSRGEEHECKIEINDANGVEVGRVYGRLLLAGPSQMEENFSRIVAAVNAVAGIPTEALEAGALGKALDCFEEMATQHRCRCEHPACNRCADDAENAAALRALGRTE